LRARFPELNEAEPQRRVRCPFADKQVQARFAREKNVTVWRIPDPTSA
jgi:hypothetical protein